MRPPSQREEGPMRKQFAAAGLVAGLLTFGLAQAADAPPAMKNFTSSDEVTALIAKAKADRKGDAPLVSEPILSLAPYQASLEYRSAQAPAAVHEKDAELMFVIDGSGTIVSG